MQEQYKLIIVDSSKIIKIFVFLKYNLKMKLKIKILIQRTYWPTTIKVVFQKKILQKIIQFKNKNIRLKTKSNQFLICY